MASKFFTKIFCLFLFVIVANGQEIPEHPHPKQPAEQVNPSSFVRAMNEFGFNLINEINPSPEPPAPKILPKNVIFSPQGLATILAMMQQGATDETAQQLEQALGFDPSEMEKSMIPKMAKEAMYAMNSTESPGTLVRMMNSYLVRNDILMTNEYVQMIQDYFDAHIFLTGDGPIVCNDPEQIVHNSVANNFNELTKSSIPKLAVQNYAYFKGNWFYPFHEDKSVIDVFYGLNDSQNENITFMAQYGKFGFITLNDLDADMIEIPMQGDQIALYGILPRDPYDDLSDIRSTLNVSYIEENINKLSYRLESTVSFPKMNLEMKYDQMIDYLRRLGINDAFSETDAKFGIMSTESKVHIDQVLHTVKIDLQENVPKKSQSETDEPSSPGIDPALGTMPKPLLFEFNHPFFYFIRHKQNGQIFIMGEMHEF